VSELEEAEQKNVMREAVVVGNPTMPEIQMQSGELPRQLNSLPGAEQEARAIAPLLNTKAIVGRQATKSAIIRQMVLSFISLPMDYWMTLIKQIFLEF
jgi:hypothetical protein